MSQIRMSEVAFAEFNGVVVGCNWDKDYKCYRFDVEVTLKTDRDPFSKIILRGIPEQLLTSEDEILSGGQGI